MIGLGDLVVCSSKAFRAEANLGLDVGIYLVDRKRDGLVFFPRPDRSEWVPKTALLAVEAGDPRAIAPPEWLVRVHAVVRRLDAVDLELERHGEGRIEVKIGTVFLDRAAWTDIEQEIGPEASPSLAVRPGSMSRVRVTWQVPL